MQKSLRTLFTGLCLVFLVDRAVSNTFEFRLEPSKTLCLTEHFSKGEHIVVKYWGFKMAPEIVGKHLAKSIKKAEDHAEDIPKANTEIEFAGSNERIYLKLMKQGKKYPIEITHDDEVNFCFKNLGDKGDHAFIIFDLLKGYHAADLKSVPTTVDYHSLEEKLENLRRGLDDNLRTYRHMEHYEER